MWRLRRRRTPARPAPAAWAPPAQVWQPPAEPVPVGYAAPAHVTGAVVPSPRPRVELGFADGAVAELDPDSPAARALTVVARSLVSRD